MLNLKIVSGIDLVLEPKKHSLVLDADLRRGSLDVITVDDMMDILIQKDMVKTKELYYIYRDIHSIKEEKKISKNKLRYDITVIRPDRLGVEYMKTLGCYLKGDYSKIYEVLSGEAWCILQRADTGDYRLIEDVILLKAAIGQKIIIPPRYGHTFVNVKDEDLIISSLCLDEAVCQFDQYKKTKGAAYFIFEDSLGERFEVNPFYKKVPYMRLARPKDTVKKLGLNKNIPIYMLQGEINKLEFLGASFGCSCSDVFLFN